MLNKLYEQHSGQKLSHIEKNMELDNFMPESAKELVLIDQIIANKESEKNRDKTLKN